MLTNAGIKYYSSLKLKKFREKEKKFLIEGIHLLDECLHSSYVIECTVINERADTNKLDNIIPLLKRKNIPVHTVRENLFNKLKETENSQGVVGVVNQRKTQSDRDISKGDFYIAFERINDPGNLGTMIRTAYWFGADGILLSKDSVDVYNSKVIRSTQGALFHSNLIANVDLSQKLNELKEHGFTIFLLALNADAALNNINHFGKTVFVFGNETEGISELLLKQNFNKIKIEGYSGCESLNVSVACGITLNHFRKVRNKGNVTI
jgi:RNA methyltransferase, TrmH family